MHLYTESYDIRVLHSLHIFANLISLNGTLTSIVASHDVKLNVTTLQRRCNDVVGMLCVCWVSVAVNLKVYTAVTAIYKPTTSKR